MFEFFINEVQTMYKNEEGGDNLENNNNKKYYEKGESRTKKGIEIKPKHEKNKETVNDNNTIKDIPIGVPVESSEFKRLKTKAKEKTIDNDYAMNTQADVKEDDDEEEMV